MNGLKPYMGYSRACGRREGAFLIFAHNIREAKRIGFPEAGLFVDEYIDMEVRLCRDSEFLFEQVPQWSKNKLARGEPHVVETPPTCKDCELWGYELDEDGLCADCAEERRETEARDLDGVAMKCETCAYFRRDDQGDHCQCPAYIEEGTDVEHCSAYMSHAIYAELKGAIE